MCIEGNRYSPTSDTTLARAQSNVTDNNADTDAVMGQLTTAVLKDLDPVVRQF